MQREDFCNESDLEFTDISSETRRVYVFPDREEVIYNPLWLHVSESGGHRLWDAQGRSHYIPKGWVHLWWEAKPGCPNFVM